MDRTLALPGSVQPVVVIYPFIQPRAASTKEYTLRFPSMHHDLLTTGRLGTCFDTRLQGCTCKETNECALMPDICGAGQCINTDGSYRCDCDNGYQFSGNYHQY